MSPGGSWHAEFVLTPTQELARLRGDDSPLEQQPMLETLLVRSGAPGQVLDRAKTLLESVLTGFAAGLGPDDAEWSERLPDWFVAACSPELTGEERERWLAHWRALDRAGKVRAEAELGWTVVDWLYAVGPEQRPWWWWATDEQTGMLELMVDGWPAPLASAEWMLLAAGADSVDSPA